MSEISDTGSMAVFCDFENVAIGVRDAKFDQFDIQLVLEKLLLKGPIIVKKAYGDWARFKEFKAAMHEAAFELIDVPHVRQSGKNSADIRLVVDALDLCYTKPHVQTFVIVSGDSDFSPLVSKLRENNKTVIGVGVKNSSSDLLIANCDEFIFYDDLARVKENASGSRQRRARSSASGSSASRKAQSDPASEGIAQVMEVVEELLAERGGSGKVWGSMVKQTLKRRRPGFNESYHGFRSFNALLEEAQRRGLLQLERDERSGGYVITGVANES
jgi:uncharacterized LabA/DUF88 family protein